MREKREGEREREGKRGKERWRDGEMERGPCCLRGNEEQAWKRCTL